MSKLTREQIKEEVRARRIIHLSWREGFCSDLADFRGSRPDSTSSLGYPRHTGACVVPTLGGPPLRLQ